MVLRDKVGTLCKGGVECHMANAKSILTEVIT